MGIRKYPLPGGDGDGDEFLLCGWGWDHDTRTRPVAIPMWEEQFLSTANVIIQNDNHRRLKSLQLPINFYSFKPKNCYNLQ